MTSMRIMNRRDFLKISGGTIANLSLLGMAGVKELLAQAVTEIPVIWLPAGACTGCAVTTLNTVSPTIQEVLLAEVVPGMHISLVFHPTVMAASGDMAMEAMYDIEAKKKGSYVVLAEGAFSTKDDGAYCRIGEKEGREITALEHLTRLGSNAMAVIAVGTCATFGGIPSAPPNPTGCRSVSQVFSDKGIKTPVINVAGCPPHPDWLIGTIATVLIGGLTSVQVDNLGRPLAFYGSLIHDNCARRGHFDAGRFAKKFSDPYCLYELGCKGPVTRADCPTRLWNNGSNWCVGCGHGCIGCVEPEFPYQKSLYEVVPIDKVTPPATYPTVTRNQDGITTVS